MARARLLAPRTRVGITCIILGAAVTAAALFLSGCTEPPKPETFWSPDGKTIAYLSRDALFLYDVKAETSTKLATGAGVVFSPCWSPDGKVIAFYSASENEDLTPLSVSVNAVDLATGQVEALRTQSWPRPADETPSSGTPEEALRPLALVFGQPASWSPDGRQLACVGPDPAGTAISLLSYPSGTTTRIVQTGGIIGWLAWSPDGKKIAYAWFPRPEPEHEWASSLWVHDLATSTTTKIADLGEGSPVEGTMIVWSADSTRIGFIGRDRGHASDSACVVDAEPGATVRTQVEDVTQVEDLVSAVAWAPGLSGFAFTESKWDGSKFEETVLVYRGLQPPVREVLGILPDEASTPQFSADGRQVSVAFGRPGEPSQVLVLAVP